MASGVADFDLDMIELETGLDLVNFEDVQDFYNPKDDIFLIYQLAPSCKPSSKDWVGLYKTGWCSPDEYITFQWAPKFGRNDRFPHLRSILFQAKNIDIQDESNETYQFLYVNKFRQVVGASKRFIFTQNPLSSLVCVDRLVDGISDLTFIESETIKGKAPSLDTFEIVKTWSDDSRSESPELTRTDSKTLSTEFDDQGICEFLAMAMAEDGIGEEVIQGKGEATEKETKIPQKEDTDAHKKGQELAVVPYVDIFGKMNAAHNTVPIYTLAKNEQEIMDFLTHAPEHFPASQIVLDPKLLATLIEAAQKQAATPGPQSVLTPPACPAKASKPKKLVSSCRTCKHRQTEARMLRKKLRLVEAELEECHRDVALTEDVLELKTIFLEDLGIEVQNLVKDKGNLTKANLELSQKNKSLKNVVKENRKLLASVTTATEVSNSLTQENIKLTASNKWLNGLKDSLQEDKDRLLSEKYDLETELKNMHRHQKELQEQFDDIMYTLSLKGVSKVIDSSGNAIHMQGFANGKVMELEGWTVAKSRKTDRYQTIIAKKDTTISDLQTELTDLKAQAEQGKQHEENLKNTIKDLETAVATKQDVLAEYQSDLAEQREKSESLMGMLLAARQEVTALRHKMAQQEKELRERIDSLVNIAEANKLIKKQTKEKRSQTAVAKTSTCHVQTAPQKASTKTAKPQPINGQAYFGGAKPKTTKHPLIEVIYSSTPEDNNTSSAGNTNAHGMSMEESNSSVASGSWALECEDLETENIVPTLSQPDPDNISLRPTSPLMEEARKEAPKKAKKPRKFHVQLTGPGYARERNNNLEMHYTPRMYTPKSASKLNRDFKRKC